MLGIVFNIFKIPELRNKIIFTIAMLMIYRIGFHIAVPCFDQSKIAAAVGSRDTNSPWDGPPNTCRYSQAEPWTTAVCSVLALCLISLRRLF